MSNNAPCFLLQLSIVPALSYSSYSSSERQSRNDAERVAGGRLRANSSDDSVMAITTSSSFPPSWRPLHVTMSEMRIPNSHCSKSSSLEVPYAFPSLLKCTRHVDAGTSTAPYQIRRAMCHWTWQVLKIFNGHLLKKLCVTTNLQRQRHDSPT